MPGMTKATTIFLFLVVWFLATVSFGMASPHAHKGENPFQNTGSSNMAHCPHHENPLQGLCPHLILGHRGIPAKCIISQGCKPLPNGMPHSLSLNFPTAWDVSYFEMGFPAHEKYFHPDTPLFPEIMIQDATDPPPKAL